MSAHCAAASMLKVFMSFLIYSCRVYHLPQFTEEEKAERETYLSD